MDFRWILLQYRWAYLLLLLSLSYTASILFLENSWYPIILFAALIPGIGYLTYVRNSDVGRREPRGVIALHILLGGVLIFPAIFLERIGINILIGIGLSPEYSFTWLSLLFWVFFAVLVVAPVEETLKYGGSLLGNMFHRENDEATDAIVYSVAVAAGFALYENYRYVSSALDVFTYSDALTLAIARGFTAIPLHLGAGLMMGYYLSGFYHPEKFGIPFSDRSKYLAKAIIYPIVIHAIYDVIVFLLFFNFIIQVISALIYVGIVTYIIWERVIYLRNKGQYFNA